jgi:N-acetylneuraminic acid mutarotase
MRYRSLLPAALGLAAFWLTACGTEPTTGPTVGDPRPTAPELAVTSNSWIIRANMPTNRTNLAAVTVKNSAGQSIVYAIGGQSPTRYPLKTVTAYNVATNTWTFRHALPVPLAGTNGAGVLNGKIYVTGGYSDYGGDYPWKTVYMYDLATNSWTRKQDMPTIYLAPGDSKEYPSGGGVTGVINGKLYVVSGAFMSNEPWGYQERYRSLFFRYNPGTDQWTTLPSPFAGIATYSPYVGGVIGGKFYVMATSPYTHDSYFAVYDPSTNRWTAKTSLRLARPGAATAVLGNKLFLMGGTRSDIGTVAITLAYDPATNAWTTRAPMPSARTGIAGSTVQLNGQSRIEVVGGIAPGNNIQYIP